MSIPTASYESIAHDYSSAIEWMGYLGVKVTSGRTTHYKRVIEYWKNAYKGAPENEVKVAFPDFVSSMFEINEFIDIYNAFKNEPVEKLASIRDKLTKGVNGPVNSVDETPKTTTARNFIFETLMAARSHHPHRGVSAILDAESDTAISINNKMLWVECKRITSLTKIESNIKIASSKLENILTQKRGSRHRGIVAIDVTKILNPNDHLFVQNNDLMLLESTDRMMEKFIGEHSNQWEKVYARRSKKVIGTVIYFSFMATSEARNLLVRIGQWAVNPRLNARNSDSLLLQSFVHALQVSKF
ncbi:MAG: hypothetical protein ABIR84_06325 [Candidatus Nitrotoga sp.]